MKNNIKIAVVVPTIRPEKIKDFMVAWHDQFEEYNVNLIIVNDGERPTVDVYNLFREVCNYSTRIWDLDIGKILDRKYRAMISNFNSSVRNLGFIVAKKLNADVIVTLDDDTLPSGDTIGDHLKALEMSVPVSWISTTLVNDRQSDYMRGFPYEIRSERPVMLSHGVWTGVPDRDAPTQLLVGANKPVEFYKGPIPENIYFPFCGMNVAFKIEALPYVYYAPVGQFKGAERFDDIWGGIPMKKDFDYMKWAIVSGYATVRHERASDPYKNLEREVIGIRENETFWKGESEHPFFKEYDEKRNLWKEFINSL